MIISRKVIAVLAISSAAMMSLAVAAMWALGRFGWFSGMLVAVVVVLVVGGSIVYSVALLSVNYKQAGSRLWVLLLMVTLVLIAAYFYLPMGGYGSALEAGRRARISSEVGLDELQSWAVKLIDTEGKKLDENSENRSSIRINSYVVKTVKPGRWAEVATPEYRRLVPKSIRDLNPSRIAVRRGYGDQKHVTISWGVVFGSAWGVFVGAPTYAPARPDTDLHRWRPGIYGYAAF